MMLEQDQRRSGVIRDLLEHIPRLLIGQHMSALGDRLGSHRRAFLGSLLPIALAALQYLHSCIARHNSNSRRRISRSNSSVVAGRRRWANCESIYG